MSRNRGDDDDPFDSCVLIGTPLVDLLPEDAKFSVKPKRPEEQIVTDEKGRQRFHGAFTGGFSAGYFNTVGSKEGWAPSTFKSSRGEKAEKKTTYRPEDFMDEDDFNEHGIAPRGLQIKSDYKDQYNQKDTSLAPRHNKSDFILDSLIRPVQSTIGVRMLRKMGWREGQGIGPKIKRKLRKMKTKINFEPGRKIYGVALPPESESDQEENEDLEDDYFVSTFDINDFQFEIKEDFFGLGYKRLDVGNLFGKSDTNSLVNESPAASLLFPMGANTTKKKGITGQSFGVGEYEDEDDIDVYKQDNMDLYDFELNGSQQRDTKKLLNKTYGFGAFEDDVQILKKFSISKKKLEPSKVFEAPQVPPNFNLMHKFTRKSRFDEPSTNENSKEDSMSSYLKSSFSSRSELLGEKPIQPDSVFDLMSAKDREFLQKQKTTAETVQEKPKNLEEEKQKKEKRYETFVSNSKKNLPNPYSLVDSNGLTEWEKEKEKDEFENRYKENLKKIELLTKNSRFVSKATLNENNQEIVKDLKDSEDLKKEDKTTITFSKVYDREEPTEIHKAALEKKYGKLTRTEYEWRPNPTVCKRFNVPNPYQDTKEYGTVKSESDKKKSSQFSLLNIMTAQSRFEKEKSRSLFDEINEEVPLKQGPSHVKTVTLSSSEKSSEETVNKIEFESNRIEEQKQKSDFFERIDDSQNKISEEFQVNQLKENVYLQERPEFDMFKAIFEDDDEEPAENEEEKLEEEDEVHKITSETIDETQVDKTTIVSSSIPNIDVQKVSRFLNEDKDIEIVKEVKPIPESVKFNQIVKSLAKKEDSSTSSSDSSSSSTSSEGEYVYEEVSISKKKSHKKKEKSKKKKKHHKKKSKKSHKKK
ncbi:unnamed protein product [Brachionus calyciflorus]|uniref:G-patch domain-containing protein n=1 Tax=Brachionus calyciflorus TaxID=104777 RepID=A0A813M0X1_9BILA|nr:unnamed protein product [Brachionus calyciflorus]